MGSEKWKQWLSGLRTGEKLPKKNQLLLILLAGILLLVIVFPVPEQSGSSPDQKTEDTEQILSSDIRDNGEYEKYLEEKTARVLEGCGRGRGSHGDDHTEVGRAEDH